MAKAKKSTSANFVKLNAYVQSHLPGKGTHEIFIRPSHVRIVEPFTYAKGSVLELTNSLRYCVSETVAEVMALLDPPLG